MSETHMDGYGVRSRSGGPGSEVSHWLSLLTLLYSLISTLSYNFSSFFHAIASYKQHENYHSEKFPLNTMTTQQFMIYTSFVFIFYFYQQNEL